MKVLVVGDFLSEIYEESICKGFKNLGCDVIKFSWIQYFKYYQYPEMRKDKGNAISSIYYRFQNKFTFGPEILKINQDLIHQVEVEDPKLVFIYRGTHIFPSTIKKIKTLGAKVFGYNNDDPFSEHYPKYFWRHYLNGVPQYDHVFSYREKNLIDYKSLGYNKTSILRSYYLSHRNYRIEPDYLKREYQSDVIFIGHFEDDGRDYLMLDLIKSGFDLKLYGTGWKESKIYYKLVELLGEEINPVYENYNEYLNSAKVSLVLLSSKNNDQYTRRVFEITVTNSVMLAPYNDTLTSMFEENEEALYFKNYKDVVDKLRWILSDEKRREDIARNANVRTKLDGHEVSDRVETILDVFVRT